MRGGPVAQSDEKLMAFVRSEMEKNPEISTTDLFEKAKASVAAAKELTMRQFHARYPLQVKRQASLAAGGGKRRRRRAARRKGKDAAKAGNAARDAVRGALLKFASDLTAAEERKDLVHVVVHPGQDLHQVLKAARP